MINTTTTTTTTTRGIAWSTETVCDPSAGTGMLTLTCIKTFSAYQTVLLVAMATVAEAK